MRRADAVPTGPGSTRPLQAVPAFEGQDTGLHRSERRPRSDTHDPHARDDGDLARRRARAWAQRGSDGGGRPRARHRAHTVRPRGRGCARRRAAGTVRPPLPSQRAVVPDRELAEPDVRGMRRHPHPHAASASPRRSRGRSSGSSTASRTSTTTSTTRSATGLLSENDLPRAEIAVLGASGSERIDRLVHDIVETSEGVDDIRQSPEVGEAMLSLRAFMFERVYLGPQAAPEHERAHAVVRRDLRPPDRAWRRRGRRGRLRVGDDRPLRSRIRGGSLGGRGELRFDSANEKLRPDRAIERKRLRELRLSI